jgi:molecular chaperone DnaJ
VVKVLKVFDQKIPGDLYVHVEVETPVKLNEHQRQLIREFDASLKADSTRHNPQEKGWFDRVKDFFN